MNKPFPLGIVICIFSIVALGEPNHTDPTFDLRDYYGDGTTNYTTAVRNQIWGTCWIFGTTGAMESNLLMTGNWASAGMGGEPDLAEYHLDKYNGFNRKGEPDDEPYEWWYTGQRDPFPGSNYDEPLAVRTHGLIVHLGGDYRISTAYLTNHGAVAETDGTRITASNYPDRRRQFGYGEKEGDCEHVGIKKLDNYMYMIPRHVEWHTMSGTDAEMRERIKKAVVAHGAVATCMYWGGFYSNGTHYQPPTDENPPNHAIDIVGWDDNKATQAAMNGAWLCRNSWGGGWNGDGHFWISYYDKHAARHEEMGGVTFRGVEKRVFDNIYSHSLHGWQYDTNNDMDNVTGAANRFVAQYDEELTSVGFYTLADDANYTVYVHKNSLSENPVSEKTGNMSNPGFHLVDLDEPVSLDANDVFFIAIELDKGGYAVDASFVVETAMGPVEPQYDFYSEMGGSESFYKFDRRGENVVMGTITDPPYDIYSTANVGESFYKNASGLWTDFLAYDAYSNCNTQWNDASWNFTVNGYTIRPGDINKDGRTDSFDFAILAGQWLMPPSPPSADIAPMPQGDGIVNTLDLAVLAEYWLRGTN